MLAGINGHLVATGFLESCLCGGDLTALERARHDLKTWRARCRLGPASSVRTIFESGAVPLVAGLGFDAPTGIDATGEALAATLRRNGRTVALLVSRWGERLDPLWRLAVTESVRRAAAWCLQWDGTRLRIVDAGRLYARRYVEFDVDLALDDHATFLALWRSAGADALTAPPDDVSSLHALVAASDRFAAGVCRSLRDGVVSASSEVLGALVIARHLARGATVSDGFEQALTIVYRLLFLLFAEARALVPLWHPVYRESYSIEALRDIAERRERAVGLWDALRAIARLAHTGCTAGDLRVTAFNGRLFAPARTPLAERRSLDDEAARRALLALSTRAAPERGGRERITYRDLGVEQLGAVYETLLDYEPRVVAPAAERRGRAVVTLEPGSGVRKATGTFYTPQPIADYLVRRTLGPLTQDATADQILRLRVLDPAMGSGAFLVAACRYLAQIYEHALVREGACHAADVDEGVRVGIRRTIAERCLYGVDLNPMAVQLARLSLWLATLASDRPLSFLDHRLQVGDSLIGAWIASLRHSPVSRRRPRGPGHRALPLFDDETVAGALREALPIRFSLESTPNDSLEQVRAKERAFAAMTAREAALSRWKRIAHLWCAAWFLPRADAAPPAAFATLSDFLLAGHSELPGRVATRYLEAVDVLAAERRFFHWELEYPEVFFDRDGRRLPLAGFDAVIGNPPWDMIRADAGPAGGRSGAREETSKVLRFTRDADVYTAQSNGHANRYQLFLERAMALTRRGGRIGLVLPSGLATDHGSAPLRRMLFTGSDVDAVVGIDNRRAVFPIHRGVRFLLVTASPGRPTESVACRLDLDDPAQLESLGEEPARASAWFPVRLTRTVLERISGPDLAIPTVRDSVDLTILERAAVLYPPLGASDGWNAHFGRELNATDDRGAFRPITNSPITNSPTHQLTNSLLPIVQGKHLEPFGVALGDVRHVITRADAKRLLREGRHEHRRLAYRDVASATNRQTLIAAVLPAGCVSTHTVFCLRTPLPACAQYFLCGLFNSFVVNYFVRLRVTTHVTTAVVERLPIPSETAAPAAFREVAALARLLTRRRDAEACARLNARVAALYQLTPEEFEHILETFPLIPEAERAAALRRFVETTRR